MNYKYIVYKTTNLINGKIYVGVHRTNVDVFDGYIGHGVTNRDKKKTVLIGFPAAVRKYGYKNFKRETLFEYEDTEEGRKQAYQKEEEIVNLDFVKSSKTYNLTIGGSGGLRYILEKKIAQYKLDGTFIRYWNSIKEASESLNINAGNISACALGKYHHAGNYQWRYYKDSDENIEEAVLKEKTVYQFDLAGNLIKVWKSASEAAKQFPNPKSARSAICQVCNKTRTSANGYYWSFKKSFDYVEYTNNKKAVAAYDDDGNFVMSFDSAADAAKYFGCNNSGNLCGCLKGKHKHFKGYRWKYFYGNTNNIPPLK